MIPTLTRRVHAARPAMRAVAGPELLARLMERVAGDAAQRWEPEPMEHVPPVDAESVKAHRFLLRCLEEWRANAAWFAAFPEKCANCGNALRAAEKARGDCPGCNIVASRGGRDG